MSATSHHHDLLEITTSTELASDNIQKNRAWDSTNENENRTESLAKRPSSMALELDETDSPEHHTRIELSHEDYTVVWWSQSMVT
ncbi:uncharacterized protein GLRG_00319 [Colletotrichum graminicola M1.001]|uniref:Uncharacterized protein n=1 Tax=Colletotrichum graminicola (strain M1.001 / M2 / FGSC 10212) TaxID=645133 RepID=E3Q274_COLGM|nr:uncharacterized protein GLRG_00319 [Colletotrichum graminicola M1.001]EFQ25175.1 hypothetical protein GLRG_00319 [Colletotrichum graminicola M1.001]